MAGRFVLVAKDNPERERRHQCASALARGDLVVPLMYGRKLRAVARVVTVESEGMSLTQGCLCRSAHAVGSVYTRFCVLVANYYVSIHHLSEKRRLRIRPA